MIIVNRFLEYLLTFIIIISLNFFLPRALPGDPLIQLTADTYDGVLKMTEEQRIYFRDYYNLNLPMHEQYFHYLRNLLRLDLGKSIIYNMPVAEIILKKLHWTSFLVLSSIFITTIFGSILGAISAYFRNRPLDRVIYTKMIVLSEIPAFILGLIFLFVFAARLKLFPLYGAYSYYHDHLNTFQHFKDIIHHAVLPVISLSMARIGSIYFLARNSVVSVMGKKYITTATAKGLTKQRIIVKHALRNAMLPVVTRVFLSIGALIGGTILVENVFAYPGLGMLMQEAVSTRDYPLIQGIFLIVTLLTLSANLIADLVYKKLDPRFS